MVIEPGARVCWRKNVPTDNVHDVRFNPADDSVWACGTRGQIVAYALGIDLNDADENKVITEWTCKFFGTEDDLYCIHVHDAQHIYLAGKRYGDTHKRCVWCVGRCGRVFWSYDTHGESVYAIRTDSRGNVYIAGDRNSTNWNLKILNKDGEYIASCDTLAAAYAIELREEIEIHGDDQITIVYAYIGGERVDRCEYNVCKMRTIGLTETDRELMHLHHIRVGELLWGYDTGYRTLILGDDTIVRYGWVRALALDISDPDRLILYAAGLQTDNSDPNKPCQYADIWMLDITGDEPQLITTFNVGSYDVHGLCLDGDSLWVCGFPSPTPGGDAIIAFAGNPWLYCGQHVDLCAVSPGDIMECFYWSAGAWQHHEYTVVDVDDRGNRLMVDPIPSANREYDWWRIAEPQIPTASMWQLDKVTGERHWSYDSHSVVYDICLSFGLSADPRVDFGGRSSKVNIAGIHAIVEEYNPVVDLSGDNPDLSLVENGDTIWFPERGDGYDDNGRFLIVGTDNDAKTVTVSPWPRVSLLSEYEWSISPPSVTWWSFHRSNPAGSAPYVANPGNTRGVGYLAENGLHYVAGEALGNAHWGIVWHYDRDGCLLWVLEVPYAGHPSENWPVESRGILHDPTDPHTVYICGDLYLRVNGVMTTGDVARVKETECTADQIKWLTDSGLTNRRYRLTWHVVPAEGVFGVLATVGGGTS